MRNSPTEKAAKIKLILTDCDGVLTDAGVYYGEAGEIAKRFHIRDGMGVELLRERAGIETGIVSGERSPSIQKRAEKLQISELHLGAKNKSEVLDRILAKRHLTAEQISFIGDDVNDLEILARVGLSACPADAVDEVKKKVDLVLTKVGGAGVFRELAEIILAAPRP